MAAKNLPDKEADNYYYPTTEEEIIALVKHAHDNGLRVRVRGAGHSMPQAIFANPSESDKVNVKARAPDGPNIEIKLDRYCAVTRDVSNPNHVTAQAGIHLGRDLWMKPVLKRTLYCTSSTSGDWPWGILVESHTSL